MATKSNPFSRLWIFALAGLIGLLLTALFFKSRPVTELQPVVAAPSGRTDLPSVPTNRSATVEPAAAGRGPAVAKEVAATKSPAVPDMAKVEAFNQWSARWWVAAPAERIALTAEGIAVATARRPEFKALIISDPRRAIAESVPRVIRQDLPAEIQALLEQPVSATGELSVLFGKAAPGKEIAAENLVLRSFKSAEKKFTPHFFGNLASITSMKGVPLRGVAIDQDFAVAENSVRPLEVGERIAASTKVEELCPVSGITSPALLPEQVVTLETPVVEIGDQLIQLCEPAHVDTLADNFRPYIQAGGSGGSGFFFDNFPGTSSRAIGNLRCLYIRATYPDQQTSPISEEGAYADLSNTGRFFLENSYGKMTVTSTVTPLVTLPHTLVWYKTQLDGQSGLNLVHQDSQNAARVLGYDPTQFDCIIVRINDGPLLRGASWGGGNRVWLTWDGMDVMNHECGHSLGLNHANFWRTFDGTAYGYGENDEYGNIYDAMGNGEGFSAHYNNVSKRRLGWLPENTINQAKTNGTYRIFAYDQPTLEEGKRYALSATKDRDRAYNLEFHPARGGDLADRALVIYSGIGSNAGHLIDTTPGSLWGKSDCGIAVGSTFSDHEADMHFTVLGTNPTTPPSLDITFNRGPFVGNQPPVVSLVASATNVAVGESITITATATDPNSDLLAYRWECSDGESGQNTTSYTRTFKSAALVTVMLTVSDMKGGSAKQSVVIGAGSHGKQVVSGTVTANGQPVVGAYLSSGGKYCYSNTDGSYALAGLSSGSLTINAVATGYTLTPAFTNPLAVSSGTNTANWTAVAPTTVKLTKVVDPVEGGVSGKFQLTRSGSTATALVVLVSPVSGTATLTTDYTFSTGYTTSGAFKSFTIPADSAILDVSVAALNDTTREGPESIKLQLTGGAGYLADSNSAMTMTLVDNDSALALVGVTAPDLYAEEAQTPDTAAFQFSRIGQNTAALNINLAWYGSATSGVDCNLLPTTVTIPAGQNSVNLILTPINDTFIETLEEIVVSIEADSSNYLLDSAAASAKVIITDDDTPFLTVTVPDPVASEAGPNSGVFLVTRSGNTDFALKVYYGLTGSALHGRDYTALNGEVMIPAGASTAPIVITPYDDDLAEPRETVVLALTNFDRTYNIGSPSQATMNLIDNSDIPLISVRPGVVGSEGGGNPTFVFQTIGNGTGNITVNYTLGGTAQSGVDYIAQSGSIGVPSNGSNKTTLTIPLIDDSLSESAETIVLKITDKVGYRLYNDSTAEDVILDNDNGDDRVKISTINQIPTEDGPTAGNYYISRSTNVGTLTVNYAVSGTATNGSDYQTLSGSLVIPDGQFGVNLLMTPINDTVSEGTELVTLTILSGIGYGPDRPAVATYEITDNEVVPITVGFQQTSLVMSEKTEALGEYREIPVVLSAASTSEVSVEYGCAGGNATGDDIDWSSIDTANGNLPISSGRLTFLPGITTQVIRMRIRNDLVIEGSETMTMELKAPYKSSLTSGRSRLNVVISDDIALSSVVEERWSGGESYNNNAWSTSPDYTGLLGGFTSAVEVGENYSRRLMGQITAPVSGNYTFWIAADDSSRLFLGTNSLAATKVKIAGYSSWTPFQSWDVNPSQKSAVIALTAGQSYYIEVQHLEIGGGDHVSVAWQGPGFSRTPIINPVADSASRIVRMLSAEGVSSEASDPLVQVVLDRPAGTTPVTVNYAASGTATIGSDYLLPGGSLTFLAGEQMKLIPFTLLGDLIGEESETVVITLSNPVGAILSSPSVHTLTLLDSSKPVVETVFGKAFSSQTAGSLVTTAVATVGAGHSITGWSIISGNTGAALAISASGSITLAQPNALPNPGMIQLKVRAQGSMGLSGDGLVNLVCNSAAGAVVEQRWNNESAFLNQDWSAIPTYTGTLATMTTPQNVGDNYSRRLTTFLKPQTTGDYTFWIAGDDSCRLFLSPDAYQANKVLIAQVSGYSDYQSWDSSTNQKSVTISLVAGNMYWFEAQQRESGGGDHVSVAWSGPGIPRTAVTSSVLFATAPGVNFVGPAQLASNQVPTVGPLSDINLNEDAESRSIAMTVGDAEIAAGSLFVSASSSDQTLIPNANMTVSGGGANRTLTLVPARNQVGQSTVSITVDDGTASAVTTFLVTVSAINDLPTITGVANQTLQMAGSTSALMFSVNDIETAVTALTLSKNSSNSALISTSNIVILGSGVTRTVRVTAAPNQVGTANITLGINDGTGTVDTTFQVNVTGAPSQFWAQQYFGSAVREGSSADLADPDSDGMSNLMEYATGGDPILSSQISLPSMTQTASQLGISFTRLLARNDVNLTVQASDDFVTWVNLANSTQGAAVATIRAGVTVAETGVGTTRNVQVMETYLNGTPPKRFMRLLVTRP